MKKFTVCRLLLIAITATILTSCSNAETSIKSDVLRYLEQHYGNTEFEIIERIDGDAKNIPHSFSVCPSKDRSLIFTVSQTYSDSNIFPFLPAIKHKVFSDNFIETIKDKVLVEAGQKTVQIDRDFDVDVATQNVLSVMTQINAALQEYGIEATKYSCAVTIDVIAGENTRCIEFWEQNEDTIRNLFRQAVSTDVFVNPKIHHKL